MSSGREAYRTVTLLRPRLSLDLMTASPPLGPTSGHPFPEEIQTCIHQYLVLQDRLTAGYVCALWRRASLSTITGICLVGGPLQLAEAPFDCAVRVPVVIERHLHFLCTRFHCLQVLDLQAPTEPQVDFAAALTHCPALHTLKMSNGAARDYAVLLALCALPRPHTMRCLDLEFPNVPLGSDVQDRGGMLFRGLRAQGLTLQFLRLKEYHRVPMPAPEQIRALCPCLGRVTVSEMEDTVVGSAAGWLSERPGGRLGGLLADMGWQCARVELASMTPQDWAALGSPKLRTLQHLDAGGGLGPAAAGDDDPEPGDQADVAAVFRHNPGLRFANLGFYDHQVATLCPFATRLTHVFWFGLEFAEATWEVMGRELVALEQMRSLDCHGLGDCHMAAWGRGMAAAGGRARPLRLVDHWYSAVSPLAVARHILPHCPALEFIRVHDAWTDAALQAWAGARALRHVEVSCRPRDVTTAGLRALLSGPAAARLQSLTLESPKEDLVLDDETVGLLAHKCRGLAFLTIGCVTGVSAEGWEALQGLRGTLRHVSIGSDTIPPDLPALLVQDFPLPPEPDTPNKRQARDALSRVQARAAAEEREAAQRQVAAEARARGHRFVELHWAEVEADAKLSAILPALKRLLLAEEAAVENWREVWQGVVERAKEMARGCRPHCLTEASSSSGSL